MCRPARGNRTRPTAASTPAAMSFVSEMLKVSQTEIKCQEKSPAGRDKFEDGNGSALQASRIRLSGAMKPEETAGKNAQGRRVSEGEAGECRHFRRAGFHRKSNFF